MAAPRMDDIAVIGMACRTAGANSPSELWRLLVTSEDVQRQITRFNVAAYHDSGSTDKSKRGLIATDRAYLMDDDLVATIDHSFFHMTPNEARCIDPQQRQLLEVAYEAIENAGLPLEKFSGSDTAVFAAVEGSDYAAVVGRDFDNVPRYAATGTAGCMAANRISYFFNLSGASMTIDTACSSSMTALHQAVRALQFGDSGMAIVCGAKMILTPDMYFPASEMGFLSSTGRCTSFSDEASGYGRGEGVLALVLKPLHAAVADNDPVRALIKGVRINQDGRTQGITMPSADAQAQNIAALYKRQNIDPCTIQYVEAHGTGTAVGDPQELSALNAIFSPHADRRPTKLVVGSVKSNIGHLEAAAGLSGIIKTILCLDHGQIPSQMHLRRLNPAIDFDNIRIPLSLMDWPDNNVSPRRAAVNCFGAGGTNGHCVLDAAPRIDSRPATESRPYLFMVSASKTTAMETTCRTYAEYATHQRPLLCDLAYTLLSRRSRQSNVQFFTAASIDHFAHKIGSVPVTSSVTALIDQTKLCWVFTGQGAQWPAMGKSLLAYSEVFRRTILECEQYLAGLHDGPSWRLSDELCKPLETSNVSLAAYAQPLTTVLQLGLVKLWRSWGLSPRKVVGHSSGEIAAAYAAGHLSLRDAIVVSFLRGRAISHLVETADGQALKGAMCAVGLSESQALRLMHPYGERLQLAAVNSPTSCTLSGDRDAIEEVVAECKRDGHFHRQLRVDVAYHSHHVKPVADWYCQALEAAGICSQPARQSCQMVSSVTGELVEASTCDARYWTDNMTNPVRFADALHALSPEACLEIGPHPALRAPALSTLAHSTQSPPYLSTCVRGQDGFESQLAAAGELLRAGIALDTIEINATKNARVLIDLPSHVWDHSTKLWQESRQSRQIRFKAAPRHPLLGSRYTDDTVANPSWRCQMSVDSLPWSLVGSAPASEAVYMLMAFEAARQLGALKGSTVSTLIISDVDFESLLSISDFVDSAIKELHLSCVRDKDDTSFNFIIFLVEANDGERPRRLCSGRLAWTAGTQTTDHGEIMECESHAHSPFLLEIAEDTQLLSNTRLQRVLISECEASGRLKTIAHPLDPLALYDVFCLAKASVIAQTSGFSTQLDGLDELRCSLTAPRSAQIHVSTSPSANDDGFTSALRRGHYLLGRGLHFAMTPESEAGLPLRSLFFEAQTLPDITDLSEDACLSTRQLILLATHKWPGCDIGILGISTAVEDNVLAELNSYERSRFRSVQLLSNVQDEQDGPVRRVREFADGSQLHLMLASEKATFAIHASKLRPEGVAFSFQAGASADSRWRLIASKRGNVKESGAADSPVVVFGRAKQETTYLEERVDVVYTALDPAKIQGHIGTWCQPYHAVIIDATGASIAASWPGIDLVPWLQHMLIFAQSITWVTQQHSVNASVGAPLSLLRTIQSEKPSIRVRHVISNEDDRPLLPQIVNDILHNNTCVFDELQQELRGGSRQITRWSPDDRMSRRTGLLRNRGALRETTECSLTLNSNGTYVVIGGLGGLGQFVCVWLAQHGVRHLTVVSRSGSASPNAQKLTIALREHGATLLTQTADARDRSALEQALDAVRETRCIKGVINMAMLLGDAPLAKMTADEWDRALRLKVDSSLHLHELTLEDPLECFILFSSVASVLGNRNQGGYNVGNAYLNSLAEHRRARGLPAVAIALGAMTDIGVIRDMWHDDMLAILKRSGLVPLQQHHLDKIMQAAMMESLDPKSSSAVILTGLQMFERIDNKLKGTQDQAMLYWTDLPDFGHLQKHSRTWTANAIHRQETLVQHLRALQDPEALVVLRQAFFGFLARTLGFDKTAFDQERRLLDYGLDSLSGVSCQYWFHRELNVNVVVPQIFASPSIAGLLEVVLEKVRFGSSQ